MSDLRELEQRLSARVDLVEERLGRQIDRTVARLGAVVVIVAGLLFTALHYIPAAHGEPFNWDRYHARQDACLEKDRIAIQRVARAHPVSEGDAPDENLALTDVEKRLEPYRRRR